MATRTVEETRSIDTTQGALYKASRIARQIVDRLEKGRNYLRLPAVDGGPLIPAAYQEAYAVRTLDALRELLREMDSPA